MSEGERIFAHRDASTGTTLEINRRESGSLMIYLTTKANGLAAIGIPPEQESPLLFSLLDAILGEEVEIVGPPTRAARGPGS